MIDESQQNDIVQMTFVRTSIGKTVIKLNQCHATIEKCDDEMISSIQKMEAKKKMQTNISMIIQDGVRLFTDNLKKLKTVKSIQAR